MKGIALLAISCGAVFASDPLGSLTNIRQLTEFSRRNYQTAHLKHLRAYSDLKNAVLSTDTDRNLKLLLPNLQQAAETCVRARQNFKLSLDRSRQIAVGASTYRILTQSNIQGLRREEQSFLRWHKRASRDTGEQLPRDYGKIMRKAYRRMPEMAAAR